MQCKCYDSSPIFHHFRVRKINYYRKLCQIRVSGKITILIEVIRQSNLGYKFELLH